MIADGSMPPPQLTPTGLPVLDRVLGGGLPIGLTLVQGNHKTIDFAREGMRAFTERNLHSLPVIPDTLAELPHAVQDMALLYGRGSWPTIIDTGDLTGKFAGTRITPTDIETVYGSLRDVAQRCNASVLIELRMSDWERPYLMRVCDTVLSVNSAGNWTVEKGKLPLQLPVPPFNPLEVATKPVTPDRVVAALLKNPVLAWKVAASLRVLGPWQGLSNGFVREYPTGDRGATVRVVRGSTRAELYFRDDGYETSIILSETAGTDVRTLADAELREHGFLLFDSVPP